MSFDTLPPISLLPGSSLSVISAREYDWSFQFDSGIAVVAEGHWRLADDQRVLVTGEDHGQLFGLAKPVDAALVVQRALSGATVQEVCFSDCSDLILQFTNACRLEMLVSSAGYENWHVHGPDGSHTLAIGGGEVCRFGPDTE
jgi:hypothetical protein